MPTNVGADPLGIGRIGRHWGLLVVFGVLEISLGLRLRSAK